MIDFINDILTGIITIALIILIGACGFFCIVAFVAVALFFIVLVALTGLILWIYFRIMDWLENI